MLVYLVLKVLSEEFRDEVVTGSADVPALDSDLKDRVCTDRPSPRCQCDSELFYSVRRLLSVAYLYRDEMGRSYTPVRISVAPTGKLKLSDLTHLLAES